MASALTIVAKHCTWDMECEGCFEAAARQRRCCSDFDLAYGSYVASSKSDLDDSVSTACESGRVRSLSGSSWDEVSSVMKAPKSEDLELPTTLTLRNLPRGYSRSFLQRLLDLEGFTGCYSFVYTPADFQTLAMSGFAFVSFCDHATAAQAKRHFQGFSRWGITGCRKRCNAAWSDTVQGLEQHIERYRNSSVMHPLVPDELKPAIFVAGFRVPFPAPKREIPTPSFRGNVSVYAAAHR
jgi:hypothetical protein